MTPTPSGSRTRNDTKAIPPNQFYAPLPLSTPVQKHLRSQVTPKKAPRSLQQLTTTPCSNKTSGNYKFSSEFYRRQTLNEKLANETAGQFLGAMPPTEFLKVFLPATPSSLPCPGNKKPPFSNFKLKMSESDMYRPFVSRPCQVFYCNFFHPHL
jgi:hypothetical protein